MPYTTLGDAMGCKERRAAAIAKAKAESFVPAQSLKPSTPKRPTHGDWHCPDCGLTLRNREKDYFHRCPGSHPVSYQQERQAICNECPHNVDDICVEYHALHPDRDCVISVGVEIPYAACPLGKWHQLQHDCQFCGRRTFNLNGIEHCRFCGGVS